MKRYIPYMAAEKRINDLGVWKLNVITLLQTTSKFHTCFNNQCKFQMIKIHIVWSYHAQNELITGYCMYGVWLDSGCEYVLGDGTFQNSFSSHAFLLND